MPKSLKITRFGNPILRKKTRQLSVEEIKSDKIQTLINDIRYTLQNNNYGVGLAAPQVGVDVALSVVALKATPNRPDISEFNMVIINPRIVEAFGPKQPLWEACFSCGNDNDTLFAKVPRHSKVRLSWLDENGLAHEEVLTGFIAHVVQHETDHLDGILFVDRVKDPSTYMLMDEYQKRVVEKRNSARKK